jgi:hypothetical protein
MAKYNPNRVPKTQFKNLDAINRVKKMMLGLPIMRVRSDIPFAYKVDPNNSQVLLPIDEHFKLLRKGWEYLHTCSFQEVAMWISKESGHDISYEGLRLIYQYRFPLPECELPIDERYRIYQL